MPELPDFLDRRSKKYSYINKLNISSLINAEWTAAAEQKLDTLKQEAIALIKQLAPHAEVRFVDMIDNPHVIGNIIFLSNNINNPRSSWNQLDVGHEAFHVLYSMLTPQEQNVLRRESNRLINKHLTGNLKEKYIEYGKAQGLTNSEIIDMLREEAYAQEFTQSMFDNTQLTGWRKGFDRIKQFLKRMNNVLRRNGFQNEQDIFNRIKTGIVGQRILNIRSDGISRPSYFAGTDLVTDTKSPLLNIYNKVKDRLALMMDPSYKLDTPNEFQELRLATAGVKYAYEEEAQKINKEWKKLTPEEMEQVTKFLTTKDADINLLPDRLKESALNVKNIFKDLGLRLVQLGVMKPQALDRFYDAYLPQAYLYHLLPENQKVLIGNKSGLKPSQLGYTKQRDDGLDELWKIAHGEIKDPGYLASKYIMQVGRDIALIEMYNEIFNQSITMENGEVISTNNWVYHPAIINYKGKPVTSFWLRNEVEDMKYMLKNNHVPTDKVQEVWAEITKMEELAAQSEHKTVQNMDPNMYKELPNSKRFGRLAGMPVHKALYDTVLGQTYVTNIDNNVVDMVLGPRGFMTHLTQLWKAAKVPFSSVAWGRNFTSAIVMTNVYGDMPLTKIMHHLGRAISGGLGYYNNESGAEFKKLWEQGKRWGLLDTTFSSQELSFLQKELIERNRNNDNPYEAIRNFLMNAKNIASGITDTYGKIDVLFKIALMDYYMTEKNMTEGQAAVKANNALFDYGYISNDIRAIRNNIVFGAPFITFIVKAIPATLEVLGGGTQSQQMKLLGYTMLGPLTWMLAASMMDMPPEDEKKLRDSLATYERYNYGLALLPIKDKSANGTNIYTTMDYSYFVPWQMVYQLVNELKLLFSPDIYEQESAGLMGIIRTLGLGGGPLWSFGAGLATNQDPFTGRPISNAIKGKEKWMDYGWYFANQFLPPTLQWEFKDPTGRVGQAGSIQKLIRAYDPTYLNQFGDKPLEEWQAWLGPIGVKFDKLDPEQQSLFQLKMRETRINKISQMLKYYVKNNPGLSEEEIEAISKDMLELQDRHISDLEKFYDKIQ